MQCGGIIKPMGKILEIYATSSLDLRLEKSTVKKNKSSLSLQKKNREINLHNAMFYLLKG